MEASDSTDEWVRRTRRERGFLIRPRVLAQNGWDKIWCKGFCRMGCCHVAHEWGPDIVAEQLLQARRHLTDLLARNAKVEILLSAGPRLAVLV